MRTVPRPVPLAASLPLWLAWALDGLDLADPPLAPWSDTHNLPGPERARWIYRLRFLANLAIFHPGDLQRDDLNSQAVQETHRRRNGSDAEGDWSRQYDAELAEDELRDEIWADKLFRPRRGPHGG